MLPRLEPRKEPSRLLTWTTPLIAVAATLVTGAVIFWFMGHSPGTALYTFFVRPVADLYGFTELLVKATPLVLCAVGLAIGFRANVWNIGAEGQLTLGAVFGGGLAIFLHGTESALVQALTLPLMLIAGVLGGMAWAAIPAFLKTRYDANEILTSLMLTYVATLLLSTLVHGPWKDPAGYNFPESVLFGEAALLPVLWDGTRLHLGGLLALFAVALAWFVLARTLLGFQVKVVGMAPQAAGYAGFARRRMVWVTLLIAGGLAGLAGIVEVAGPIGQLLPVVSPGYGFTAIIVAFLGRLHPLGILFAALVLALSYLGGETAQIELGLPQGITGVFQGMILFFLLASDVLIRYRVRFGAPAIARPATVAEGGERAEQGA